MKILINASNLAIGGGIQVAVSFIAELRTIENDHVYCLLLSKEVASQLELEDFDSTRFEIVILYPKKGLLNRILNARQLSKYEQLFKPDVIFSVFGPILWRSKAKHVVGFAFPYLIYPESPYFKFLSVKGKLKSILYVKSRKYFFIKNSDYFITETEDASTRLSEKLNIEKHRIFTVSNTVNSIYPDYANKNVITHNFDNQEIKLLTLSSFYPHKNISIIKKVIPELEKLNVQATFYLTIDSKIFKKEFSGYEDWVYNYGPAKIEDCPGLYNNADVMFLPTLLECFSASYPEAMCMQRPILTSDLSFARGICNDAALFFDPLNPKSIADAISKIKNDKMLYKEMVIRGNKVFSVIPSAKERAYSYLNIISKIGHN